MALTFTKKVGPISLARSAKLLVYQITHDGSETSMDASDFGINYINYAIPINAFALSGVADMPLLSGDSGTSIAFKDAITATTLTDLIIFGY